MGKPAPGDDGSRSDRGESAEGAPDHAEREEERSDGRRAAGTAGPSRSEAVGADTTPGAGSTSRPGGNPGTGRIGGCADEVDQRGAGAGKTDGRPAEELRRRLCEGISGRRTQRGDATRDPASLLKSVEEMTEQIGVYDKGIQEMERRYPETKLLKQVNGVGTLIGLTFMLTLEDAERFEHSRDVGPYLGLRRKQRDSGDSQPELGISKAGDELLRRLLVQGAHCILRDGAPDSDLKAWGLTKVQAGAKTGSGKK